MTLNTYKLLNAQRIVEEKIRQCSPPGTSVQKGLLHCVAIVVEVAEMMNESPSVFKYWRKQNTVDSAKLIAEYVDVVSLFLVEALERGWENSIHSPVLAFQEVNLKMDREGIAVSCLEIVNYISSIGIKKNVSYEGFEQSMYETSSRHERYFKEAWTILLAIGFCGFGFTAEEIEQAYFEKNHINIERQETGY